MRKIKKIHEPFDIAQIFASISEKEEAVFLDSSLQGALGKYSMIACRPYLKLKQEDGIFTVNGIKQETTFLTYVKDYLQEHKEVKYTDLPIESGAVGYFSYDFGRELLEVKTRHRKTLDIPEAILYFYDIFLIADHEEGSLYIVANGKTEEASQCIDEIYDLVRGKCGRKDSASQGEGKVTPDFGREDYKKAVDEMIRYIVDGDIYVVNMTHQLQVESDVAPFDMFCSLRDVNPSPFGSYMDYGDFQIVSASCERFMKMKDGIVFTRPIKGTRKRGKSKEEDERLYRELAESAKDQSELLMIVDLERNDLNRVCDPGSVKVTELFSVETYATVFHLIANIEGRLRSGLSAMDLMEATFPGGSITGAPKLRAMELIDQEERSRRNLYTGSIGYISLDGDCDFNIVIRTAVHKDQTYHIGVGGGITCESDLEFEYEETWQKSRALLQALGIQQVQGEDYEYTVG